jgi:hypothetical protein
MIISSVLKLQTKLTGIQKPRGTQVISEYMKGINKPRGTQGIQASINSEVLTQGISE